MGARNQRDGSFGSLFVLLEIKGTVLLVCCLLCWKSKGRFFWFVVCFAGNQRDGSFGLLFVLLYDFLRSTPIAP